MSWILPKGIVVNAPGLEGTIERINTEPLDLADIAKFWKGTVLPFPPSVVPSLVPPSPLPALNRMNH